MATKIKLGDTVKDKITDFQGVVISITHYLNGCVRAGVQPTQLKDGKTIDAEYFDIQQIEKMKKGAATKPKKSGGPMPAPPRF